MRSVLVNTLVSSGYVSLFISQFRLFDLVALFLLIFFGALLSIFSVLYVRTRKKLKTYGIQLAPKTTPPLTGNALICRKCNTRNAPAAHFCRSCGSQLPASMKTCSSCGESNLPTARYCRKCGKPLK